MHARRSLISSPDMLQARLLDIQNQLKEVERFAVNHPEEALNIEKLAAARSLVDAAEQQLSAIDFKDALQRKGIYSALISAQVELDYTLFPGVDPAEGWVRLSDTDFGGALAKGLLVDTQLMRFYLSPDSQGALLAFDYKPRKFNLCDVAVETDQGSLLSLPSFVERFIEADENTIWEKLSELPLSPAQVGVVETKVMRQTLDSLGLRFVIPLGAPNKPLSLVRDCLFKSGIGAHEPNYNTGFSVEYWLEANEAPDGFVVAEWNFFLPTGSAQVLRARPLACFGGESEEVVHLDSAQRLDRNAAPGGIYGLRIIDSADNFVFDIRFSKFLFGVALQPLFIESNDPSNPNFQGIQLRFLLRARDIYPDTKTSTMFFSIR